jgi:AcrR family transcriptional regulator
MLSVPTSPYHHGDLRNALLRSARDLLERSGEANLSLRSVARDAGVSSAAPYRHFADKDELLAALAAMGYRELTDRFGSIPTTDGALAELIESFLAFAESEPHLFRLMFSHPCTRGDAEPARAGRAALETLVRQMPDFSEEALTAAWALAHGLAALIVHHQISPGDDRRGYVAAIIKAAAKASP